MASRRTADPSGWVIGSMSAAAAELDDSRSQAEPLALVADYALVDAACSRIDHDAFEQPAAPNLRAADDEIGHSPDRNRSSAPPVPSGQPSRPLRPRESESFRLEFPRPQGLRSLRQKIRLACCERGRCRDAVRLPGSAE